jgi:hypothetical protein
VPEKLRASARLAADEAIKAKGLVLTVMEFHEAIDKLVAEACGWPGGLTDEEIVTRFVALNAGRLPIQTEEFQLLG